MVCRKIRCNDEVIVITGKDKGKRGIVKLILSSKNRAIISGINLIKKHRKPIPDKNSPGGIFNVEASINLSNVSIFNPISNQADHVSLKIINGKKNRIFKSNRKLIK